MSQTPQNISPEQQSIQRSQRMILDFNKNGLNYLTSEKTYSQAHDYFKKAQKTILQELKINPENKKINQLAAITYNNLACYYKKLNKPKVALSYLKKALEIQVYKVENWISTASTHLNICAIYSFMKKHDQAKQHAILSNKILQKINVDELKQKNKVDDEKSFWNIKMLAQYNTAIELEYLKNYDQSEKYYQQTKQIAQKDQQKNSLLIKQINQGLDRVKQQSKISKQRILQLITKKKENQQKGNYEFMRKNKKNYQSSKDDWRNLISNRKQKQKFSEYKVEQNGAQRSKKYQSLGKLTAIKPILHTDKPSSSIHKSGSNEKLLQKQQLTS